MEQKLGGHAWVPSRPHIWQHLAQFALQPPVVAQVDVVRIPQAAVVAFTRADRFTGPGSEAAAMNNDGPGPGEYIV